MLHLVRRFFGYVTSDAPTSAELDLVRTRLSPELFDLFGLMNDQDQRHALEVADRVSGPQLVEAALLHDVGKSVSALGAVGRSLATIAGGLRVPVSGSWDLYLRHGEIGASMLESAGADPLTVGFARLHPGPSPPGIPPEQWRALKNADDV